MFTSNIEWECEDRLALDITDGMFKASKIVDGVRMYPFIAVGGIRFYLENDNEIH